MTTLQFTLLVIVLVIWFVSGLGLILFVLLHSGKGTGLSDIIAGSVYNNTTGTSLVEKNLDRITVIFATIFFITLLILMLIYPQGTVVSV
ncbi:MAG: preprotein translocase subunit SecG [Coriobacteriales bacterium]|nr:preprotein translocase subunit SecG [Coriobacteriales bacterium]